MAAGPTGHAEPGFCDHLPGTSDYYINGFYVSGRPFSDWMLAIILSPYLWNVRDIDISLSALPQSTTKHHSAPAICVNYEEGIRPRF